MVCLHASLPSAGRTCTSALEGVAHRVSGSVVAGRASGGIEKLASGWRHGDIIRRLDNMDGIC